MGQLDIVEIFIQDYPFPLDEKSLKWMYDHIIEIKVILDKEIIGVSSVQENSIR